MARYWKFQKKKKHPTQISGSFKYLISTSTFGCIIYVRQESVFSVQLKLGESVMLAQPKLRCGCVSATKTLRLGCVSTTETSRIDYASTSKDFYHFRWRWIIRLYTNHKRWSHFRTIHWLWTGTSKDPRSLFKRTYTYVVVTGNLKRGTKIDAQWLIHSFCIFFIDRERERERESILVTLPTPKFTMERTLMGPLVLLGLPEIWIWYLSLPCSLCILLKERERERQSTYGKGRWNKISQSFHDRQE
jgi:hypothetical protein